MMLEEVDPIHAFRRLVLEHATRQGNSLLIVTRLSSISQEFVEKYSKLFGWHFRDSERSLLTPNISNPVYEFSYYDRIHKHFGIDQLDFMLEGLRKGARSRVISTWDQHLDLATKELIPCLTLLQFRVEGDSLDLSVVFRSRDIIRRMIPNWNALKILQEKSAEKLGLKPGWLSDYSLQWFYRHEDLDKLKAIL